MARYLLDTSALVKRYRAEAGTVAVDRLFADPASTFFISRLGIVETTSALALKVRLGELSTADYDFARNRFLGDTAQNRIQVVRMLVAHYRGAELLIHRHAQARRLRTLDALQLSVALELHHRGRIDSLVSADASLCQTANAKNLPTLNPASPD